MAELLLPDKIPMLEEVQITRLTAEQKMFPEEIPATMFTMQDQILVPIILTRVEDHLVTTRVHPEMKGVKPIGVSIMEIKEERMLPLLNLGDMIEAVLPVNHLAEAQMPIEISEITPGAAAVQNALLPEEVAAAGIIPEAEVAPEVVLADHPAEAEAWVAAGLLPAPDQEVLEEGQDNKTN